MSDQPHDDNAVARENVRSIMLSMGIDVSGLSERTQSAVMDYMLRAFDWYTQRGADFGSAVSRAWDDIVSEVQP